jgi:signal transduction histidine kinase
VIPLESRGVRLGNLYVKLRLRSLHTVRTVIGMLSVLLVVAVVMFVMQLRRQERVISRTTVELEEKRRELVRIERLALAGQLSAGVFHDIRKPIRNIREELNEFEPDSPDAGDAHGRMREQVNMFFDILRDCNIEKFAASDGEREYVDVNEEIGRSLALVRYEQRGVTVETSLARGIPSLLAHRVQLIQVFSNLILNAYQAMDGRGKLTVDTVGENDRIVVEVSDTGPGIPRQHMDRIFAPFFTTKPTDKGTGLGLYITHDIIRSMGGRITVRSDDKGTTFRIELPVEEARQEDEGG